MFGPLTIPKLVKGDSKTFLFLSYNGTRARSPYNATATLPTLAERMGDFSQSFVRGVPVQIFDPTTHRPSRATGSQLAAESRGAGTAALHPAAEPAGQPCRIISTSLPPTTTATI